ncbi:hypothetical protein Pmani_037336 [Petrolisthes manimaculis]|uniref:Uncharacterized protein n=1 Tax=Petrolisthes manimaculis TaxID=1843537 RepID=A0AAE1TL93_9EUCA|nr:hypothetical protein Pmani_037336 [Petrolisthes manimaculis]
MSDLTTLACVQANTVTSPGKLKRSHTVVSKSSGVCQVPLAQSQSLLKKKEWHIYDIVNHLSKGSNCKSQKNVGAGIEDSIQNQGQRHPNISDGGHYVYTAKIQTIQKFRPMG